MLCAIWHHCVRFTKRKKHSWRSVTFKKVTGLKPVILLTLQKVTLLYGCFSGFLNFTNGTKPHLFKVNNKETITTPI